MAKKKVFNLWKGGKVDSSEIFYMLVNFEYLFLINHLASKFGKYVINFGAYLSFMLCFLKKIPKITK